tara:strand:+ start:1062 stop:1988 length:927 start_codon:yes stop_codon:yes gene_type:complete
MAQVSNTQWLKDGLGGSQNDDGIIEHSESVIITFTDFVTNTVEAIADSGFRAGQRHRSNNSLVLQAGFSAAVHDDDNAKVWVFDLEYSTVGFNSTSVEDDTYTPEITFGTWTYSRVVSSDKETGLAIQLPTGEPYDPQFEEQVSSVLMHITIQEYAANLDRINQIGSINDSEIRIGGVTLPKYCAMLADYKPKPFRDSEGYLTFKNTFAVKLKFFKNKAGDEIGFKLETVAASFNELVNGALQEITVKTRSNPDESDPAKFKYDYVPVATPQFIDEAGAKTNTPYYQEHVVHDLASFRAFGLPTNYPD